MNFVNNKYPSIQSEYNTYYGIFESDTTLTLSQVADSANGMMAEFLKKEWKNIGAENMIAQTRTASSYGLLQMLYTTATWKVNSSKTKVPEDINLVSFFEKFILYQKNILKDHLGTKVEDGFNWPNGYEQEIKESVFEIWNEDGEYPKYVLKEVSNFLPQN